MVEQYDRMLQKKPYITSRMRGYSGEYNVVEDENESIETLNGEFANYAACQIQTDSTVSVLSK